MDGWRAVSAAGAGCQPTLFACALAALDEALVAACAGDGHKDADRGIEMPALAGQISLPDASGEPIKLVADNSGKRAS